MDKSFIRGIAILPKAKGERESEKDEKKRKDESEDCAVDSRFEAECKRARRAPVEGYSGAIR